MCLCFLFQINKMAGMLTEVFTSVQKGAIMKPGTQMNAKKKCWATLIYGVRHRALRRAEQVSQQSAIAHHEINQTVVIIGMVGVTELVFMAWR